MWTPRLRCATNRFTGGAAGSRTQYHAIGLSEKFVHLIDLESAFRKRAIRYQQRHRSGSRADPLCCLDLVQNGHT
jgi:hypothetical protein